MRLVSCFAIAPLYSAFIGQEDSVSCHPACLLMLHCAQLLHIGAILHISPIDTNQEHEGPKEDKNAQHTVCGACHYKVAGLKGICMLGCVVQPSHMAMHYCAHLCTMCTIMTRVPPNNAPVRGHA